MDILVTGGAGFIGSHLCEALVEQGHRVTCLDDFSAGSRANLGQATAVEIVTGDVNDLHTFTKIKQRNFDAVFHYAATVGVERTEKHPDNVLEDAVGIAHIARLARAGRFKKVIFASSSEVYGPSQTLPESEGNPLLGQTPYALVKRYGELTMQSLWRMHHIPAVALRFFNVYGPRQVDTLADAFVVARFINQVRGGVAPSLMDGGRQTRDLVYVKDNVKAALAALGQPEANGEIINVGTGREVSIAEIAYEVIRQLHSQSSLIPQAIPGRTRDITRRRADTAKMERLLGMVCETTFTEGLKETIQSQAWTKTT